MGLDEVLNMDTLGTEFGRRENWAKQEIRQFLQDRDTAME